MNQEKAGSICKQLENELTDWKYIKTNTHFVNKSHRFVQQIIRFAWYSPYGGTVTSQPSIMVNIPEVSKTYKHYIGHDHSPYFRASLNDFTPMKGNTYYIKSDQDYVDLGGARMGDEYATEFVRDVYNNGEELLNRLYDFSSYDNFISSIPADLNWSQSPCKWQDLSQKQQEYEKTQRLYQQRYEFIYYGLVRMKIGDFDYIQNYKEQDNIIVADIKERCDKIIENIPMIKDTWEKTGNLI